MSGNLEFGFISPFAVLADEAPDASCADGFRFQPSSMSTYE